MGKYYAVKAGFDKFKGEKIENTLYDNWPECQKVVKGVKGAKYKSFTSKEEADKYLFGSNQMSFKNEAKYPVGCNHTYVDGSFDATTDRYSYGLVITMQGIIMAVEHGTGKNTGQRQITGECEGALKGLVKARLRKDKQVVIFHDYNGVGCHATGEWKRNSAEADIYYNKMQKLMQGIEVEFVKVAAHEGDLFNELADDLAKEALNVKTTSAVSNLLVNGQTLKAGTEEVYRYLCDKYGERFIVKAF